MRLSEAFGKYWDAVFYCSSFLIFFVVSCVFYYYNEGWSVEKSFGFILVTITTVGYGYTYPTNDGSRAYTIFLMFFGVYFVFSTVANTMTEHLNVVRSYVKKEFSVDNNNMSEIHLSHRRTLILYFISVVLTILVGGLIMMGLEGWSFVTAIYFCVETVTTVGYGDLSLRGRHTQLFVCGYIIFSVVLLGFVVNSIQQLRVERKQLHRIEEVLLKRRNLDFLFKINNGKGISEAQFVLAVLQHIGTVDADRDVLPWVNKFREYDVENTGSLDLDSLEVLTSRESENARSQLALLDDSTKRSSLVDINDLWSKSYLPDMLSSFTSSISPFHPSSHHDDQHNEQQQPQEGESARPTVAFSSQGEKHSDSISSNSMSAHTMSPLRKSLGQTEKDLHDVL